MNIIVRPYGSEGHYCRPDTTWEKESRDLYIPEGIDEVYWAPVAYVRVSKAGKCIGKKFADRYYDAFGFGAMLYLGNGKDIAFTSCADHTSLLPHPLLDKSLLKEGANELEMFRNKEKVFGYTSDESLVTLIEETLCKASGSTSLRIGDHLAVELAQMQLLTNRDQAEVTFEASCSGEQLFTVKVIL